LIRSSLETLMVIGLTDARVRPGETFEYEVGRLDLSTFLHPLFTLPCNRHRNAAPEPGALALELFMSYEPVLSVCLIENSF
jgi:hypothetical protein